MTPKEKAQKLYRQYFQKVTLKGEFSWSHEIAKDCAIIAVDEVINTESLAYRICGYEKLTKEHLQFWQQVKHELKNNEFDI
jgi:hypothetical protein